MATVPDSDGRFPAHDLVQRHVSPLHQLLSAKLLWLFVGLGVLFHAFPQIDLWFSGLFFDEQAGFFLRKAGFNLFVFEFVQRLLLVLVLSCVWLFYASWRWCRRSEVALRRHLVFLIVAMALGPGFLVNTLSKMEMGRARPVTVEQFGGSKLFSPAFVCSNQCAGNCSFVSGHASMGCFFMAFAWVFRDRRWLAFGVMAGLAVGFVRITQGAHFLSDVVFSGVFVYVALRISAWIVLDRWWAQLPHHVSQLARR